jgi:hypothetical protein
MGSYLDVNVSFLETIELTIARILFSSDIKEGLAKEMEMVMEDRHYIQKLDYGSIPFRCH